MRRRYLSLLRCCGYLGCAADELRCQYSGAGAVILDRQEEDAVRKDDCIARDGYQWHQHAVTLNDARRNILVGVDNAHNFRMNSVLG